MTKCNRETEVFSRVVGYHRPIKHWNAGKKEEFHERKPFTPEQATAENTDTNTVQGIMPKVQS